ncbi:MAG: L,D-transpeptidase family protein [Proteobacteria bacterium]|nr:L,D-transpeptidase family protein [Pseudomonadota bacterium]
MIAKCIKDIVDIMTPSKLKYFIATVSILLCLSPLAFHSHATIQATQKQQDIPDCLVAQSSGYAIVVDKKAQKLFVYHYDGRFNKVYETACSTGKNQGTKMVEGDSRTPEGIYFPTKLFTDNQLSSIYGSMAFHLDYPNLLDKRTGKNGNNIWIHGTNKPLRPFQSNGCVTLTNKSIKHLFIYIKLNKTPVIIEKSVKWIPQDTRLITKNRLEHFLNSWIKAIAEGDVKALSSFYDDKESNKQNHKLIGQINNWKTADIPFSLQPGDISILKQGEFAVILFNQVLSLDNITRSGGYRKLFLKENQSRWLVVGDVFQPPAAKKLFADTLSTLDRTVTDHRAIGQLIEKWVHFWKSGDMENYRSCYAPDFRSRGISLNNWISYKTGLKKRNKNIHIRIENIKITSGRGRGLAAFTQKYSSSNYSAVGTKKLRFKKADGEWKIYRETWTAMKDTRPDRIASEHRAIRQLIEKWVQFWESGDMENYRLCYAPDFRSRGMNLGNWIFYKTGLKKRNKNIRICIEDIKITSGRGQGLAAFTQKYSSSNYNAVGTKKLRFRKADGEWKIYRETWTAMKDTYITAHKACSDIKGK